MNAATARRVNVWGGLITTLTVGAAAATAQSPAADGSLARVQTDGLYVAFPKGDPADPPARITPDMIDEDRLLLLVDGHCLKDHALAACNRPELRASATMLGTSLHTLVQMVDNGLGLTLIPDMAVTAGLLDGTDVQARPLNAEHASREIALIWRTNSPRREEFEMLADALRELRAA